eukprot:TRINITY_DN6823_c0_g1_i2.p1 TRINITY_DN6823_c0_g1~~TRINITY_DN6823_c0_g1_i2.p1  ORF type:complete len:368 (-),score=73.09 TRINITY_DN6823_c0_g1_i2:120-1223(-)
MMAAISQLPITIGHSPSLRSGPSPCTTTTLKHIASEPTCINRGLQSASSKNSRRFSYCVASSLSLRPKLGFCKFTHTLEAFEESRLRRNKKRGQRRTAGGLQVVAGAFSLAPPGQQEAAKQMVDLFIKNDMAVGLGSGPTSSLAIEYIGQKLQLGTLRDIKGVAMSSGSATEAAKAGICLHVSTASPPEVAFAFTDADTVEEGTLHGIIGRRYIPGREGFLREKEMAGAAMQFAFFVKDEKFVDKLEGDLPVLIKQEDWLETAEEIDDFFLGDAEVWRRSMFGDAGPMGGDMPLVTDDGNFVLDVIFTSPIVDAVDVAQTLDGIPGVVGHGLVLDGVYAAVVWGQAGGVRIRTSLFKEAFTAKTESP